MTRLATILIALLTALSLHAATYAAVEVPNVHKADRTQFVADPDGFLSAADRAVLNERLAYIRQNTTAEPMVAIVGSIPSDTDIDTYATELFSEWGLGKADKDNGLLIVVAVDDRRMTIRTGYGLEGVLPDIVCGRIIREQMRPAFQESDYGSGLIAAVQQINRILTDPEYAQEIRSSQPDADSAPQGDRADTFHIYIMCACGLAAIMLFCWLVALMVLNGRSREDKYRSLAGIKPLMLILTFVGLGIPLVATIPYLLVLNHWRNHRRACPHCGTSMKKIDEVHDNDFLTPSQDLEEKIGSVDYDVWLCPKCNETDIIPFVTPSSQWRECPNCHARTARLVADRITRRPTATMKGMGVRQYECLNCHHRHDEPYEIPRDDSAAIAALGAAAVLGSSRRSGGFGGGGFSGGSFGGGFGGGMTGGGGASGGW